MLKLYVAKKIADVFFLKNTPLLFCKFCKMADRRKCKTNSNSFCYVCGKYSLPAHRRSIGHKMKTACKCYFGCKVGDQDMVTSFAAILATLSCSSGLLVSKKCFFVVPMMWREPTHHVIFVSEILKDFLKKQLNLFIQAANLH